MVPQKLQKEAEDFIKMSEDLSSKKREIIKMEAEFDVVRVNFWHNIRQSLEKNGAPNVYEKSIDFDADARKEGFLVVNLYDERNGQPLRMR